MQHGHGHARAQPRLVKQCAVEELAALCVLPAAIPIPLPAAAQLEGQIEARLAAVQVRRLIAGSSMLGGRMAVGESRPAGLPPRAWEPGGRERVSAALLCCLIPLPRSSSAAFPTTTPGSATSTLQKSAHSAPSCTRVRVPLATGCTSQCTTLQLASLSIRSDCRYPLPSIEICKEKPIGRRSSLPCVSPLDTPAARSRSSLDAAGPAAHQMRRGNVPGAACDMRVGGPGARAAGIQEPRGRRAGGRQLDTLSVGGGLPPALATRP
jgi:hypothetical protein